MPRKLTDSDGVTVAPQSLSLGVVRRLRAPSLKAAVFLFLLCTTAFAEETFRLKECGVSLITPDGWRHDDEDTFGYVLRAPNAKKTQKLRVHFANKDAKSVREAAELSLKRINEIRASKKQPLEDVLSSAAVQTRSGIEGWRSAHGFRGYSEVPYIVHYYFRPPGGRIVCVCAYVMYDAAVERHYDEIILGSLKFLGP